MAWFDLTLPARVSLTSRDGSIRLFSGSGAGLLLVDRPVPVLFPNSWEKETEMERVQGVVFAPGLE